MVTFSGACDFPLARRESKWKWRAGRKTARAAQVQLRTEDGSSCKISLFWNFCLGSAGETNICSQCYDMLNEDDTFNVTIISHIICKKNFTISFWGQNYLVYSRFLFSRCTGLVSAPSLLVSSLWGEIRANSWFCCSYRSWDSQACAVQACLVMRRQLWAFLTSAGKVGGHSLH